MSPWDVRGGMTTRAPRRPGWSVRAVGGGSPWSEHPPSWTTGASVAARFPGMEPSQPVRRAVIQGAWDALGHPGTPGRGGRASNRGRGTEPVSAQDEVTEFAALLRELKGRTDRSYGSLARRLHMNTSTLHRYCAGDAVPVDFAPVERFAALCGATDAERLELHRRWLRAAEARRRPRAGSETPRGRTRPVRQARPVARRRPVRRARPVRQARPAPLTPRSGRRTRRRGHPERQTHPARRAGVPPPRDTDRSRARRPKGTAPHASPDGERQHRAAGHGTESGDTRPADQAPPPDRPGTATRDDRPGRPARGEQPDGRRTDASADAGSAPVGGQADEADRPTGSDADDGHVVTGPAGHPAGSPSRRWRRKRVAVAAAAMCALLATVGSLSFLPDDRRTATGSGTVGAAEETDGSGTGEGAGPARSVAPSHSPLVAVALTLALPPSAAAGTTTRPRRHAPPTRPPRPAPRPRGPPPSPGP